MKREYEYFCIADPLFYDTLSNADQSRDFPIAVRPAPSGWARNTNEDWVEYIPQPPRLPIQGWKIHVSGCHDNAERMLDVVWDYCIPRRIGFKFLRSISVFFMRNAKYAFRGGSGKLVTIYPLDNEQAETICHELDSLLNGEPGPYILSDLRFGKGPLYLRYGGFAQLSCLDAQGQEVPAIQDPSGRLVPDTRSPAFETPSWVTLPGFLQPHLAARNATTVADLPYEITQALHFSNGGGVYLGTDKRTGEPVVLKEARPHAGLASGGSDAVQRLRRERDILARLAGIEAVPKLLDYFTLGEHEFLVQEFIDGEPLNDMMVARHPLVNDDPAESVRAGYAAWAMRITDQATEAIRAIHERGIVYGDLHTFNILVRPDGRIALIDFEVAVGVDEGIRPGLAAPDFIAPRDRTGFDIDLYALACLRFALFLPMTSLFILDAGKAAHFAEIIADAFPVPRTAFTDATRTILGSRPAPETFPRMDPGADRWEDLRDRMARAILDSATPDRDDRLFPGDVVQFEFGGLNFAYGAAGVLWALHVTGAGRHEAHERWLLERCTRAHPDTRVGFYNGLHGVAYALDSLGYRQEALKVLEMGLPSGWEQLGDDLFGGLAGIGLNCAHFADLTGDPAWDDAARRATEIVAGRLGAADDVAEISGGDHPHAGLMSGSSGRALLFLRMFERTADTGLLNLAHTAIRQDLRRCVTLENGAIHVNEDWRSMPYLATGSAGIGLVIERYLRHRRDDELADAADGIRRSASGDFYIQPGLFDGRAGTLLCLDDPLEKATQIRRLAWHALDPQGRGHLAFPGEQLMRLSMDLATGTAGVLLATAAVLHKPAAHLPFLSQGHQQKWKEVTHHGDARSAETAGSRGEA